MKEKSNTKYYTSLIYERFKNNEKAQFFGSTNKNYQLIYILRK